MSADLLKIVLIRHGETSANLERRYAGSTDVPVSRDGLSKLIRLRENSLYPDISGYVPYTGERTRTQQTLAVLWPGRSGTALSFFNEMDFGAFEMHTYEELKDDADYLRWIADQTGDVRCPGGESKNEFRQRVHQGMDAILFRNHDALIVTHGGVIACLMQRFFPGEGRHFYQWQPANGCGYLIELSGGSAASFHDIPTAIRKDETP